MQTKLFEIRDRDTFIPVMATAFFSAEHSLLRQAGYDHDLPYVIVIKLTGGVEEAHDSAFGWLNHRTMTNAHLYIEKEWDTLVDGDVIDVEFILGETSVKKTPQGSSFKEQP